MNPLINKEKIKEINSKLKGVAKRQFRQLYKKYNVASAEMYKEKIFILLRNEDIEGIIKMSGENGEN